MRYDFEIVYTKGTEMYLADTLIHAYLPHTSRKMNHEYVCEVNNRTIAELETENINMTQHLPISEERLSKIQQSTNSDEEMNKLKAVIKNGWPEVKRTLDKDIQKYYPFRDELSVQNGLIFNGERAVVPRSIIKTIMERTNSSHIGEQWCLRRACESVYWPSMNKELEVYTASVQPATLTNVSNKRNL